MLDGFVQAARPSADQGCVDQPAPIKASPKPDELESRWSGLDQLLRANPDAIVAALADNGCRVSLPESFPLGEHRALEVPAEASTMLDVIVPEDRIAIVAAWERTRARGISVTAVHALTDPGTRLSLTMVDARERYGAWLGFLTPDTDGETAGTEVLSGPLVVPTRPRQATMHKSMTALISNPDANTCEMFGFAREQLVGARSSEFVHPDDHDRSVATWMQLLSTRSTQRVRLRHLCADGTWLWVELENIHNGAEDPDQIDVTTHISDISDEMAAHEALRRREQLFSRLAEALPTGVLQLHQDGSVAYANTRLSEIMHPGATATTSTFNEAVTPADRPALQAAIRAALEQRIDGELEVEVRRPDEREARRCVLTVAAVDDQDGEPAALVCVNDVTESAQLREELRRQATHDPLTGCLNRSAVMQGLDSLLDAAAAHSAVAVFVDMDNFKPVNDQQGHAAGDQLLIAVARRLQSIAREGDLVARLGGDEFLLLCQSEDAAACAAGIGERVRGALRDPVVLPAGEFTLQASIGVACSQPRMTAETLIAHADAAMYESKRQRKGEPILFSPANTEVSANVRPLQSAGRQHAA